MSVTTIRTFIAVAVPDMIRQEIGELESSLKGTGDVRWVRPESLHITLKFLGDVQEDRMESVFRAASVVSGHGAFMVSVSGLGRFPASGIARVLWVGIEQGAEELKDLAAALDGACASLGYSREKRPFSPHLTIGRVRSSRQFGALETAMKSLHYAGASFPVSHIHVMKSDLHPAGALYERLHSVQLKG